VRPYPSLLCSTASSPLTNIQRMNGVFLFIFTCFWSACVIAFDGFIGRSLWNQFASRSFTVVTGQITHSQVTPHRGSKGGITYGVDIRYRYTVNDRSFDGKRFRYNANASSDSGWAKKAVAAHPVGSHTQVFYNPRNPQEAVLSPGVDGSDLMLVLFLMPFNIVMVGFWTRLGGWLRERILKPVAGGVRMIAEGPYTRIRLPQYTAMVWCMVAVGGVSFASVFLLGFASRFHPSLPAACWTLVAVAAAGVGVYWWQWRRIHSGDDDLILDEGAQTMELPETYGRKDRVTVAFSDVERLAVETIVHRSRKGGVSYTYAPTLWLHGRGGGCQKLADWSDRLRAEGLADWLRERLGLTKAPVDAPSSS